MKDDFRRANKDFFTGVSVTAGFIFFIVGFGTILFDTPVGTAFLLLSAACFTGALLLNNFFIGK